MSACCAFVSAVGVSRHVFLTNDTECTKRNILFALEVYILLMGSVDTEYYDCLDDVPQLIIRETDRYTVIEAAEMRAVVWVTHIERFLESPRSRNVVVPKHGRDELQRHR